MGLAVASGLNVKPQEVKDSFEKSRELQQVSAHARRRGNEDWEELERQGSSWLPA